MKHSGRKDIGAAPKTQVCAFGAARLLAQTARNEAKPSVRPSAARFAAELRDFMGSFSRFWDIVNLPEKSHGIFQGDCVRCGLRAQSLTMRAKSRPRSAACHSEYALWRLKSGFTAFQAI